jgi:hypothetical protein
MKRAIVFTFPRPLTQNEEGYFISAFQEAVVTPTGREIKKQANKFSKGFYGKVIDRAGATAIVLKLQALSIDILNWMELNKESNTRYSFTYDIDALSGIVIDIPKTLQPTLGKKLHIGKFIPDRQIIRFFRNKVFPEMHLKAKEVQIEKMQI